MWVTRLLRAPRVELRRFIMLLTAGFLVATFALAGPFANTAFAADAVWNGTELTYDGNSYTEVTAPPDQNDLPNEYQWIDTATQPDTAYVLYFGPDNPGQATSATLYTYDLSGTTYTNQSSPVTIGVSRDALGSSEGGQTAGTTCRGQGGLGWVICPLSNYLADGIDAVYRIVENFFNVQTITRSDNGVYQFWKVVQSIANAAFIGVFLIIIYSQITGAGFSNYNIKEILPRLILGAVLVNVSFWICAAAVDISNLLGYSLQSILVNIRENIPTTPTTGNIGWSTLATAVLAGGGVVGYAWMAAAVAQSATSLGFILLFFLIPAALSVLTAFIVLAVRQALIVILTAISPLAFVAFILPGTRDLFHKWRKLFTNMLVMFPAFALLFGGSQIASLAIINSSEAAEGIMKFILILIGLAVQVVPLALTPLLSRLSTGVLSQITGMINNKEKGLADRAKNWAQDNAEAHKQLSLSKMGTRRANLQERLRQRDKNGEQLSRRERRQLSEKHYGARNLALRMDQKKRDREKMKKIGEDVMSGMNEDDWNRRHNRIREKNANGTIETNRFGRQSLDQRTSSYRNTAHTLQMKGEREKGRYEAANEEHWNQYENSSAGQYYRDLRKQTHIAKGRAKLDDDDMTNADEYALKSLIQTTPNLRAKAERASLNAKKAAAYQSSMDAAVEEQWTTTQKSDPTFRNLRTQTDLTKKRSEDIDKSLSAADQRTYDALVNAGATPEYREIRQAKKQTVVDTSLAQFDASEVESEGKREYRALFEDGKAGSRELRKQNVRIEQLKKETSEIESTLQDRADAHWERLGQTDAGIQEIRLKRTQAADSHKEAELQWNTLIENIRAEGADAPGVTAGNATVANTITQLHENIAAQERAIEQAKIEQSENLTAAYKDSMENDPQRTLLKRAAGIGGERAQTRIYAKAKKDVVSASVEEVKTNQSLTSEMTRFQLHRLMRNGKMPNGDTATLEMQQAAMYTLLQEKGNNEDAQEIRDAIAEMGMMVDDETGLYYEPKRDANGWLERNERGFPILDKSKQIVDADEIGRRRDWQQFFLDAASGSSHSMVTFSGTNKSEAAAGTMVDDLRGGFMRDATGGKFSAQKMLKADIDELKFLLEDLNSEDGAFSRLSPDDKEKAKASIKRSILSLQENENVNAGIDDRNRGVMNDILNTIDPEEYSYELSDNGDRIYSVDKNNAIVAKSDTPSEPSKRHAFRAPVNVPGVHFRIPIKDANGQAIGDRGYYQKWHIS